MLGLPGLRRDWLRILLGLTVRQLSTWSSSASKLSSYTCSSSLALIGDSEFLMEATSRATTLKVISREARRRKVR